jgi:putative spermidine/putrescine transport system permease protein
MSRRTRHARGRAALLIAPLVIFLGVFFLWPLWLMIDVSIRNDAIGGAFPRTSELIGEWDGEAMPDAGIQSALVADLRETPQSALGAAVRTLNSQVSGFRTLMGRTATAARDTSEGETLDLPEIDERWREPRFWRAIQISVAPYTDRNLLAALDLQRGETGEIEALPASASANRLIVWRTFAIAGSVTLLCALIGLPYAMLAASVTGWKRNALLLAVLLPLWTSLLVRTAAWFILLQNEGLINRTLIDLGWIDRSLPLIFNRLGVVIAMTHVLLPFMVLPIFSVVSAIPKNLMPAAASLGARPLRAFWRVLLPLSLPGLLAGSLLVFMVAIGYYITPALIGGPNDQMISSVIAFYALQTANWGMAGALGILLLAITTVLYMIYGRLSRGGAPTGT